MIVQKIARRVDNYFRPTVGFVRARDALHYVLNRLKREGFTRILLPGYIGQSVREGSGIYDPILKADMEPVFYRMDARLAVDIRDFEEKLCTTRTVTIIVHYFGYVDSKLEYMIKIARDAGSPIIEDCAHAFFTDYVGGRCGSLGDYSIYSLHKLFPFENGGMLRVNRPTPGDVWDGGTVTKLPWEYDFSAIARSRIANTQAYIERFMGGDGISMLHPLLEKGIIPQTFPVVLEGVNRDSIYEKMNAMGLGVVTLYYALIEGITPQEHPDAHILSRHILNLPTHQDVTPEDCKRLADSLIRICEEERRRT